MQIDRGQSQVDVDHARNVLGIDAQIKDMTEGELNDIVLFLKREKRLMMGEGTEEAKDGAYNYQPYKTRDLEN